MIFKKEISKQLGTYSNVNFAFINEYLEFNNRDVLILTSNVANAKKVFNNLTNSAKNLFLTDELSSSNIIAENEEIKLTNASFYEKLINHDRKIIVTNLISLNKKHASINKIKDTTLNFEIGDFFDVNSISKKLNDMGYVRVDLVEDLYQYAVRGFVVDVSVYNNQSFRVVVDDENIIEEIKIFDLNTQKTITKVNNIKINNLVSTDESTYFDEYLNNPIVIAIEPQQIYKKIELLVEQKIPTVNTDQVLKHAINFNFSIGDNYLEIKNLDSIDEKQIKEIINTQKTCVFSINKENIKIIDKLIEKYIILNDYNEINPSVPNVICDGHQESFEYQNVFYINLNRKKEEVLDRVKESHKIALLPGDYIVHEKYGIGLFEGLKTLKVKNIEKEYLKIKYAKTDVLYVPVEKVMYVKKYAGIEGFSPKLNRLTNNEWTKTKRYIKEHLKVVADEIIKLAAERKKIQGIKFNYSPEEDIFWHNCPFNLTPDQQTVWDEVRSDMEDTSPMDRLVCGDVGFGKTEIAFRAMFKATINGYQTLYICPTTILAKQQYLKALERFKYFGANIKLYDRSINDKDARVIEEKVGGGNIDILIGTHRTLNPKINFKNLGLIVVDEEQRFGVNFKEKIKQISIKADLLTLSATPIPRTLQMSLAGLKEFSLINTPPFDRMSILTYVLNYNLYLIKEAIENELERAGQVFYLQNRIEQMDSTIKKILSIMPDLKIASIHGKMSREKADAIIAQFLNKEYDVLMATTIIETGIDMPNVNTIIVENADMLGLGQLYQLRGRVGRSNRQAYAYLMVDDKIIKDEAVARLKTIKNFTALGSGIEIARRDLAIRGAGNILGREQAGFINSIGIELYNQFLEQEINKLNGLVVDETVYEKPLLNIETDVLAKYIFDEQLRIDIHQLINTIVDEAKYKSVKLEIIDRFGKIDHKIDIYLKSVLFEKIARSKGIIEITDDNLKWYIKTNNKQALNGDFEYKTINEATYLVVIAKKELKTIDQFIKLVDNKEKK